MIFPPASTHLIALAAPAAFVARRPARVKCDPVALSDEVVVYGQTIVIPAPPRRITEAVYSEPADLAVATSGLVRGSTEAKDIDVAASGEVATTLDHATRRIARIDLP